ncbi:MAG: YfhO family protein [Acidobacteriaceae bacterium]|nr:YfhO family protein [Acidobacteriaceae bacterium]
MTENIMETEFHTWQTRLLFGVRYTISEKPPLGDSRVVFTGASGLKVFENPGAFPRAWAVHEVVHVDNAAVVRSMVNDHLDEFRRKAFTNGKVIPLPSCDGTDQVEFKKYEAEKVVLSANMACQGLVVLSDTYFPGWRATVDGKTVQIQPVNNAMRGVVVPRGPHEVVMRYRPASVYWGGALTLLGWVGALALVLYGPKAHGDDFTV